MDKTRFKKAAVFTGVLMLAAVIFAGCASVPAANPINSPVSNVPAAQVTAPASGTPVDIEGNKILVDKLTVSATGSVKLMPDVAYVNVSVITSDKEMKKAQSANTNILVALNTALTGKGLTKNDIRTTGYNVGPLYDYTSGKAVRYAYQATSTVEITVKDYENVGDYAQIATDSGANVDSVSFDLLDKDVATNEALADAMKTAKGKADALAAAGGYTITGVLEVTEGSYNYSPPQYYSGAKDEAAGAPPINAGQMEITASITVIYQIK